MLRSCALGNTMLDVHAAIVALATMLAVALVAWAVSVAKKDASIIDSFWPLFFVVGALTYVAASARPELASRTLVVGALLGAWALRLCVHITWRNWGEGEDRRYLAIRARNQPGFAWKSLYLVFGLQAMLAWIIAMPVFAALSGNAPVGFFDGAGIALWLCGFAFEGIGDWQLSRFTADPANHGRVLDTGLWRFTRHPNYFGEATLWWGLFLLAIAAGAAWTVFAPLLMTFMLLKVSGVALLEKDIGERRPAYRAYIERTSAFIPWPPRTRASDAGNAR